jgi:hypothetical protein
MSVPMEEQVPAKRRDWLEPPGWWKKFRPLRWIALGLIGFGLYSWIDFGHLVAVVMPREKAKAELAARYSAVVPDRQMLIDTLNSYDNVQQVTQQLTQGAYTWQTEEIGLAESDKFPPCRLTTLTIAAYKHLGAEGKLTLEFFNDRLYEAGFNPKDAAAYLKDMKAKGMEPPRNRTGNAELINGNLRVASNLEFAVSDVGKAMQTKPFIVWQDVRLMKQLRERQ